MPNKDSAPERLRIIAETCAKYPTAGHDTLARRLYDKHPEIFPTLNAANCAVRWHRGNRGKESKQRAEKLGTARTSGPALPQSSADKWEPFVLDARRALVLSDIHLPYLDNVALEAALDYGDDYKPDAILINGDLFDFYQISRFDRSPTKPKLSAELAAGKQLFAHLADRFGVPIYFKLGNHDERWDIYLALKAPELFDLPEVRNAWHGPAGIIEHNVHVIRDQRPVMLGKLMVLHGHEKGRGISSPVNPARGAFMRLLCNVLEGHGHRQSEHTEKTGDGRVIACWSTGCLCDDSPEYARFNKWSHGFATVDAELDGTYQVNLHRIIDGKVM